MPIKKSYAEATLQVDGLQGKNSLDFSISHLLFFPAVSNENNQVFYFLLQIKYDFWLFTYCLKKIFSGITFNIDVFLLYLVELSRNHLECLINCLRNFFCIYSEYNFRQTEELVILICSHNPAYVEKFYVYSLYQKSQDANLNYVHHIGSSKFKRVAFVGMHLVIEYIIYIFKILILNCCISKLKKKNHHQEKRSRFSP